MLNARRIAFVAAIPFLLGCQVKHEENAQTSTTESRIFPPGQGPVTKFDLQPAPAEVVQISSKDVHAQRNGGRVVLHFNNLEFARNPSSDKPEIELTDYRVRVYKLSERGLERFEDSDEEDFRNKLLTPDQPRTELRDVKMEVENVGSYCTSHVCVVTVEASYYGNFQKGKALGGFAEMTMKTGSMSESAPIELTLGKGLAAPYASKSDVALADCSKMISVEEASKILGEPVEFGISADGGCNLRPGPGGQGMGAGWSISEDVSPFEKYWGAPDAISIPTVGDRAYTRKGNPNLFVLKGGRMLAVSVRDSRPGELRQEGETIRKQIALARKLLARM